MSKSALKARPKPGKTKAAVAPASRRKPAAMRPKAKARNLILRKADPSLPAWVVTGAETIAVRAGTTVRRDGRLLFTAEKRTVIKHGPLTAGQDYVIALVDGVLGIVVALEPAAAADGHVLGGFHFAPGGNADPAARKGGDSTPAINPFSLWDLGFRPACPDPRGMAFVAGVRGSEHLPGFWCDIYLLAQDHEAGTSRSGAAIADGWAVPAGQKACDYAAVSKVYARHGKGLLSLDEFAAATLGVTEKTARGTDPATTGLDALRTSARGIMQATGNLSTWGFAADPDADLRRPAVLGGYWSDDAWAGSRSAGVASWPDVSDRWISARGRSDHLQLG